MRYDQNATYRNMFGSMGICTRAFVTSCIHKQLGRRTREGMKEMTLFEWAQPTDNLCLIYRAYILTCFLTILSEMDCDIL